MLTNRTKDEVLSMNPFPKVILFALVAALALPACSDDSDNTGGDVGADVVSDTGADAGADVGADAGEDVGEDSTTLEDTTSEDVGDTEPTTPDDVSDAEDGTSDDVSDVDDTGSDDVSDAEDTTATDTTSDDGIPDQITTEGAEFEGVIPANGSVDISLLASEEDIVVMWLRVEGGDTWNPDLALYQSGALDPLVYSNSQNGEDAHIPYQDEQLQDGFEFFNDGAYRLELANQSAVDGHFRFTLECLAGPCADGSSGPDAGTDPDAGPDAGTDPDTGPDPDAGDNPFTGLSDDALEAAMRQSNTGRIDLGYGGARDFMFQYQMDNVGAQGEIECVYTGRTAFVTDRRNAQDQHDYNTEHTWPQSLGATGSAKSDIHHLFITDMQANGRRGSYPFCNVVSSDWSEGGSKLGTDSTGQTCFEPRDVQKGNTARAMFYFAVTYQYDIPANTEATLRAWATQDPVTAADRARNDAVSGVQMTRNFFVDYPELIDEISDF